MKLFNRIIALHKSTYHTVHRSPLWYTALIALIIVLMTLSKWIAAHKFLILIMTLTLRVAATVIIQEAAAGIGNLLLDTFIPAVAVA